MADKRKIQNYATCNETTGTRPNEIRVHNVGGPAAYGIRKTVYVLIARPNVCRRRRLPRAVSVSLSCRSVHGVCSSYTIYYVCRYQQSTFADNILFV